LAQSFRKVYPDRPRLEEYLAHSGLTGKTQVGRAVTEMEKLLYCDEGEVFTHPTLGSGLVESQDLVEGKIHIRFSSQPSKPFTFEGVRQYLTKVPKNHFVAQRVRDPQGLREKAESDPVGFAKLLLKSFGGTMQFSDIKAATTDNFFSAEEWSAWWSRHRAKLRRDPFLDIEIGTRAEWLLRSEPKSLVDESLERFQKAETVSAKQKVIREFIRLHRKEEIPHSVLQAWEGELREEALETRETDPVRALELVYLREELLAVWKEEIIPAPELDETALIRASGGPRALASGLSSYEHQVKALLRFVEISPETWAVELADLLTVSSTKLGALLAKTLLERKQDEAFDKAIDAIVSDPYQNTDMFLWAVRGLLERTWDGIGQHHTPFSLVQAALNLIKDLQDEADHVGGSRASALRGAATRFKNFLQEDHHKHICQIAESLPIDEARRFRKFLLEHRALNESYKASVDYAICRARHEIAEELKADTGSVGVPSADGVHYCLAATYQLKQNEYQRLKTEEIPANSRAIGEAAAQGDLSENAEYDAAKNQQKILFRRVEALEGQLQRARILDPDHVSSDAIGVGTRFVARNLELDQSQTYTLLGIWEANPAEHVISYLTPFGQQFINKKAGDKVAVVMPEGGTHTFEIVQIEKAV
ncbi:MAG: GreA/GreB family elongation factor, partial [bacterium]